MKTELKRQDMEELHQLLSLYERTYGSKEAGVLLVEVEQRYSNRYREDVQGRRNPRNAGRKKRYTEGDQKQIRELREEGLNIREIAQKTGCSVGYVQGVLSAPKT